MGKNNKRTQKDLAEFWEVDPIHLSGCLNGTRIAGEKLLEKIVGDVKGMPLRPFTKKPKSPLSKPKYHPAWIKFFDKWEKREVFPDFK